MYGFFIPEERKLSFAKAMIIMSFSDIIKNSVLSEFSGELSLSKVILSIVLAFVISLFIIFIYKVTFRGVDITNMPMYQRARMGMGYLAQEPSIFRKLTVEDNIMAILETLDISSAERRKRCAELLEELELTRLKKQKAMTLSGGERRRLEITRALVTNPSFIMLDEPFAGVDPLAVYDVQQIILQLKNRNLGILITDHNVRDTLQVVDRAYIMCMGNILLEGPSEFLVRDEKAKEIYLGPQFSM